MKPRQPYNVLKPKAIEALSFHHLGVSELAILERAA